MNRPQAAPTASVPLACGSGDTTAVDAAAYSARTVQAIVSPNSAAPMIVACIDYGKWWNGASLSHTNRLSSNGCMDGLLHEGQARPMPTDRCFLPFSIRYRRLAAVEHTPSILPTMADNASGDDGNLLRFDEEPIQSPQVSPSPSAVGSMPGSTPFAPPVCRGASPTRDGFFARLAAALRSPPALEQDGGHTDASHASPARSFTATPHTHNTDATLDVCPVCSASFAQWPLTRRQEHLDDCIQRTEARGSILGDRYSTHRWSVGAATRECSICYEEFTAGQQVAVLNCLCQYHQPCIATWFERGKLCPFHSGGDCVRMAP